MKRHNIMSDTIKKVYDEMVTKDYFSFEGKLKAGIFIDPGLGSAQAQKINSFIHGYDGDNDDRIISVSDVYCQKIWITCFICANLLTEAGLFKQNSDNKITLSGEYNLTDEIKAIVLDECKAFLQTKLSLLKEDDKVNNISEKLIDDIQDMQGCDIRNYNIKQSVAMWITEYAIRMLLLHEYSHIINNDNENEEIDTLIEHEKRADIVAYTALAKKENYTITYLGALCLQSSGLFLNHSLEGIFHPDTDVRIEYIYNLLPKCEIFKDCLEIFISLWAHVNNQEESFLQLAQSMNPESLFGYLETKKKEQINQIIEEGQKHFINNRNTTK
ncbi:MAG: hypothetical protein U0L22_00195 [Bacteroidales bacterium]|nr:hypothetical protein [Bacteroidales bacterium]